MALWLVTILSVFGGSVLYDRFKTSEYDVRAESYLARIIPVLSEWDAAKTRSLMAPEVTANISAEHFAQAMNLFSRLGQLQKLEKPRFIDIHQDQDIGTGKGSILEYTLDAVYENADAEINIKLLPRGDSFEIYRFNFSSEILL